MILLVGQVPRAFRGREAWQELDYARRLRRHREGGVGDRQRRPDSRAHGRGVLDRALRAGPGRSCSRFRRTCSPRRPTSRTPRASRPSAIAPAAEDLERLRELLAGRRAPARRRGRGRLDGRDEPRRPGVLRGERAAGRVRVSLPGLRRQPLAELRRRARRRDGRGDRRPAARRRSRARDRRPPRRGADAPLHAPRAAAIRSRRSSTCIPIRASSAASTSRISRSPRRCPRLAAALRALDPVEPRWSEWTTRRARRLRAEPRARADGGRRRPRRDHGVPPAAASRRRGPDVRRGQLHRLGASLRRSSRSSARRRARDRARWATGFRPRSPRSSIHPDRVVVCFTGDGDFVMSSPELATAVQYDLPIVVLLVNNGMYATIRMHQERQFPGRVDRHRPREPRLPRARARVRCARRAGRADRGLRGGVRARARLREAVGARASRRPRADQPAREAERAAGGAA